MLPIVYLAGPDVFLPDPHARGETLRRICAAHGLAAVFPLDPLPDEPTAWSAIPLAHAIARRNEAHIRRSSGLIANLTPFRGPGADNGTAYEIGFARALGLPVYAWTNDARDYRARCAAPRDAEGLEVEDFNLADNLMIACAVILETEDVPETERWRDLAAFSRVAVRASRALYSYERKHLSDNFSNGL